MKIQIKNKEVELKYSIRSLMMFENILNKSFSIENTQDTIVFFYCVILASDRSIKITFDEFIDLLDEKPEIMNEFANWLATSNNINKLVEEEIKAVDEGEPKKLNA